MLWEQAHVSHNNTMYTLSQWSPTIYDSLGATALQTGTYLAVPGVVSFFVNWVVAAVEMKLMQMGISTRTTRRAVSLVDNSWLAVSLVLMGMANTPLRACLASCAVQIGMSFQGMTWGQNCETQVSIRSDSVAASQDPSHSL